MLNLAKRIVSQETYTAISQYLPADHSRRQSLEAYLKKFFDSSPTDISVLDLGCGEGDSLEMFRRISPDICWQGVDIEDSPEVRRRVRNSKLISTFDGVHLPYSDGTFDLLYCHQVLEHVRKPDALIAESLRVTKPGRWFVGSVSYLEPFHSYSIFNFTPYGVVRVFTDTGFELEEIRPGVDASHLITRQLFNRSSGFRLLWKRNVLHGLMDVIGTVWRLEHRHRNFLKILFSGHLVFIARRPNS